MWLDATEARARFESSWASSCKVKATFKSCGRLFFIARIYMNEFPWGRDVTTTSLKDPYFHLLFFRTARAIGLYMQARRATPKWRQFLEDRWACRSSSICFR